MQIILTANKSSWMFVLDTSAFRNMFNVKLEDESLLLKLLDVCELCMPVAAKEEITEALKNAEFASSRKEEEEITMILKNTRILSFPKTEKKCFRVIKRTDLNFQRLRKKADKQCVSLSLQLSRHEKYRFKCICLITDDTELFNIAQCILHRQFAGNTYFLFQTLVLLSVRNVLRITRSDLVDLLTNILASHKKTEKKKEVRQLIDEVKKNICPYSCKFRAKCFLFTKS